MLTRHTLAPFRTLETEILIPVLDYVLTLSNNINIRTRSALGSMRLLNPSFKPSLSPSFSVLLVCKRFHEYGHPFMYKRNRIVFFSLDGQTARLPQDPTIDHDTRVSPNESLGVYGHAD